MQKDQDRWTNEGTSNVQVIVPDVQGAEQPSGFEPLLLASQSMLIVVIPLPLRSFIELLQMPNGSKVPRL
jgi:hypothetical protein